MNSMAEEQTLLRKRINNNNKINGEVKHETQTTKFSPEFRARESILTVLIESSLHIRAMYHIFVVILIMLLLDTVIFDFIEHGK